jgi:AhpD family alkylhydroperoxidase
MRAKIGTIACVAVVLLSAAVTSADTPKTPSDTSKTPPPAASAPMKNGMAMPTASDVMTDVNNTLGFVPEFIKAMPDTMVVGFWSMMKTFQMNPDTKLDAKTKELIGLAVSAQIPCEYCVYFHTVAAKKNGATDQEVKEAVGMAAMTRMASTAINGMQVDKVQFKKDVDRIMKGEKNKVQARVP